jgi:hypothetical protein
MKKAFYLFTIVLALFLYSDIDAQGNYIGVRGGISIPNLSAGGSNENPLNTGYSSRLGADFGIFGQFTFSHVFSFQPMIEYSSQGGKKNGFQAFPNKYAALFPPNMAPTYLYADFKSEARLNYLLVPLLAKFGWNLKPMSPIRIYIDAGPFAGFLLSAKQVTSGSSEIYADEGRQQPLPVGTQSFDTTTSIKDQLHTFNVGAEANVGISYRAGNGYFFLEGGFNYGFLNIQKGTANGKNNTGAGTVNIGYASPLGARHKAK